MISEEFVAYNIGSQIVYGDESVPQCLLLPRHDFGLFTEACEHLALLLRHRSEWGVCLSERISVAGEVHLLAVLGALPRSPLP